MLTKLGMSPERFRVEYVSAAEGIRYAEVIKELDANMKALGKEKILAETTKMRPILENMLKRKASSASLNKKRISSFFSFFICFYIHVFL
jgi:hypothetical protein